MFVEIVGEYVWGLGSKWSGLMLYRMGQGDPELPQLIVFADTFSENKIKNNKVQL